MLLGLRRWAPFLDGLAIVLFVFLGRENHGLTGGMLWMMKVLAPLAVGFVAMALATRLYTSATRMWLRLAVTIPLAVLIGGVLRWIFRGMPAISVFTVIATGFLAVTMFGWRGAALLIAKLRAGRDVSVHQ